MRFKSTATLWLAAICVISFTVFSFAEEIKKPIKQPSCCKAACKAGKCEVTCDLDVVAAPACGAVNCLDLLGKLAGLDISIEVAEVCCCSDACKCGENCNCSKKSKCQPTCKCKSPKAKIAKNIWGEKHFVSKRSCCESKCGCKNKACCGKAVAKKQNTDCVKKLATLPAPRIAPPPTAVAQPPRYYPVVPHPHVFHGPQVPVPYAVPHIHHAVVPPPTVSPTLGPHPCPQQGTHAWQLHEHLVKLTTENAKLKAAHEVQQQLIAQQREHQQQMLAAQSQIVRLQAQVELVSRREEIRDQIVEAKVQAAQAEWWLELASESPETFVKILQGDSVNTCSGKDCEVHAIKAENNALRAKVAQLEKQIQEIIKHTAQRKHSGYQQPAPR